MADLIGRETASERAELLPPGPNPSRYIGSNVADLESLIGRPALVRQEGRNEFRRYDLDYCRVYAIVAPAGGNVQTLSTGPLVSGQVAPNFSTCTAGL